MEPTTGYAALGDHRIAYQVIGEGPIDLVFTTGFLGSFDVEWDEPAHRLFFRQMARFARVIRFDQLGTGASDPILTDLLPPWESFAEEIEAVMDAVGSDRAVLVAGGPATTAAMLFAATRPERLHALVLLLAAARYTWADDYPIGFTSEQVADAGGRFQRGWGTGEAFDMLFPSRSGDERLRAWYAKLERSISSPGRVQRYQEAGSLADARPLLPSIVAPTLVMHPSSNAFLPEAMARYVADHIEGARFIEIPSGDIEPWWDRAELVLDTLESFVTGTPPTARTNRQLATVLFTDIVDSTGTAERLGDRRWASLLDLHDATAKDLVEGSAGRLVKTTGDGVLAIFDGPGRAIRAAEALRNELETLDVQIRAGVHAGEVEVRDADVGGIAVHLAARIMATADPGEILVSHTVRDLMFGSDISLADRGTHDLRGIEGRWSLFSVTA